MTRQGIALSLYSQLPVADGTDPQSHWSEGTTSVLVSNILSQKVSDASNQKRAAMPIYARAYVQLADGTYIYGDAATVDLRQVTETIDSMWSELDATQKTAFTAMCQKFWKVIQSWNVPNLNNTGCTLDF